MQSLLKDQEQIIHDVHRYIQNWESPEYPIQIAESLGLTEQVVKDAIWTLIDRNVITTKEVIG